MTIDYAALGNEIATENNIDMTKPKSGGGAEPLAAGPCRLRFVGYVELGKQNDTFQGKPVVKEKVRLTFEVSGPKHPPYEDEAGNKRNRLISFEENYSLNEKAHFFKLFNRMNYAGKARHIVGLLGQPYKGEIIHRTYKKRDGSEGIAAELFDKARGYTIDAPRVEDPETGEFKELPVAPATAAIKCFVWAKPTKAQWDSIFIDGTWPEVKDDSGKVIKPARSKNELQEAIKKAVNFKGSPIAQILGGAEEVDIPDAESGKAAIADDPLNGVGA